MLGANSATLAHDVKKVRTAAPIRKINPYLRSSSCVVVEEERRNPIVGTPKRNNNVGLPKIKALRVKRAIYLLNL
jgi:hypothetical protein